VCRFCIQDANAERARQVVVRFIIDHLLTIRVSKDVDHPFVYDIYESGKRIREESYIVK
jgi:hypothetical protein